MPTLWLVGMMGSGKSTVGRLVADRLGMPFVDLDREVERATGRTISDLFSEGEGVFRAAESDAVAAVAGADAVVACGGGVVLDGRNVAMIREHGTVVWLDAPTDVLAARVGSGDGRPLLSPEPGEALETILAERRARYEDAAHRRVDASSEDVDVIAGQVMVAWTNSS